LTDEQLASAKFRFRCRRLLLRRNITCSIFHEHFPSDAAALCVPQEASVACSTKIALEWDEAFKNMNDPSRAANVHSDAYAKV
jgi:asparagine synthase (glutamine-hydrolysing)